MRRIQLDEALYAIEHTAEILKYDEPMPRPTPRHIEKLQACLDRPHTSYGGKYLYWTLPHRAAVLFYTVIKNHPLENGNKRSAVILTMYFLFINGKTFRASPDDVYNVACRVAESPAGRADIQIGVLKNTFKEYMVSI